MTKLTQLWTNVHQSPVTTILGLVAGACTWLAARPELGPGVHFSAASVGALITGAAVALLGAFTSEKPASATTVTTTTTPK